MKDGLVQWYSTFFACVSPDIISLQLCAPKVVGVYFKLYTVYSVNLKLITSKVMY
jgi:hypothetical protein